MNSDIQLKFQYFVISWRLTNTNTVMWDVMIQSIPAGLNYHDMCVISECISYMSCWTLVRTVWCIVLYVLVCMRLSLWASSSTYFGLFCSLDFKLWGYNLFNAITLNSMGDTGRDVGKQWTWFNFLCTLPEFAWRDWGQPWKSWFRTARVSSLILTRHLSAKLNHYCLSQVVAQSVCILKSSFLASVCHLHVQYTLKSALILIVGPQRSLLVVAMAKQWIGGR